MPLLELQAEQHLAMFSRYYYSGVVYDVFPCRHGLSGLFGWSKFNATVNAVPVAILDLSLATQGYATCSLLTADLCRSKGRLTPASTAAPSNARCRPLEA